MPPGGTRLGFSDILLGFFRDRSNHLQTSEDFGFVF